MIKIGNYNTLKIKRLFKGGAYLEAGEKEIYLPKKEFPGGFSEGDDIEVFVYNSGPETLSATTEKPLAVVDEFAFLKVAAIESFGAFLEWGIAKDLFLPNRRQTGPLHVGKKILVRVVPDFEGAGLVADMNLEIYFNRDTSALSEEQQVDLMVYGSTPLGMKVIVDGEFAGLVYRSEGFREADTGERLTGYVAKIREDGKLDISLKRKGYDAVIDSTDVLLAAIKESGGFLPLHDKSSPEEVRTRLGMSKKLFKKAAGGLYKNGLISIEDTGLRLKE